MNDQNEQLGKETWPVINYGFVLSQLKAGIVQFQTEIIQVLHLQNISAYQVNYSEIHNIQNL